MSSNTTTNYRLSVTLERDDLDEDGMMLGTDTMLRLDVESDHLAEVAAVLSAATDVISGRADDSARSVLIPDEVFEALRGERR